MQDLKQQKFQIEVEPSETVSTLTASSATQDSLSKALFRLLADACNEQILQVKEKIQSEKGWEAGTQKLIYSGIQTSLPSPTLKMAKLIAVYQAKSFKMQTRLSPTM